MLRRARAAAAVLAFVTSGVAACAPTPRASDAAVRFHAQLADDWTYWMTEYPEVATAVGFPGQNARWTDYTPAATERRAQYLRRSLDRLGGVDRSALIPADQVSYDLYRDDLDAAIKGLTFHYDPLPYRGVVPHSLLMPVNQLEGVQQDAPRTITTMPSATRQDYEDIVARLRGVGALVDQTIAQMQAGLAAGVTPPRQIMRDVPAQVAGALTPEPLRNDMLAAFGKWPASIPEADRADLAARAVSAYREVVAPAFTRLHDFLVATYLPACRETVSAAALPDGASLYAYNVRWHTTTGRTPAEIHAIGLAEVARIRAEMDAVIASTHFPGDYEAFKTFLRTDRRFYFADARSLLAAYRDITKRADPELAHLFGHLPETPYGVQAVPDAIAPSQTTAYYQPGAFAAGRPGVMFANTYKLDARPSWEMEALTMHESVPGHHVQISLAQEQTALPDFRKNSSYTAFVEGWGLYAESLGAEMGFYTDPYAKFGQLTYDMWRAVRLVVDTGIHSMGWTREQAIAYFRANAAKTDQDITVEVDRYIVWPGQALGYKMGQLKIRELRTAAERRLGPRFDVRQFHDVVLGQGAVPLDVLERQVNAWVEGAAAAAVRDR